MIEGADMINQDSHINFIDETLPEVVNRKVNSVELGHEMNLKINLEGGVIYLCPSVEYTPDAHAWTLYENKENGIVEAWTVMWDKTISYWTGKRPDRFRS
jgi:hypothetical protein